MALQKASGHAFSFVAAAAETTVSTFALDRQYYVKGIQFMSNNATFGDYIKIELVDVDDVLGLGAGTVLATPVQKAFVSATTNSGPIVAMNPEAVKLPIAGLYVRVSYTNSAAMGDVNVYINLILFEDA